MGGVLSPKCGWLLPLLVLAGACSSGPPTTVRELSSGRKIEVVSMGTLEGDNPTWVLEYRTLLPLGDRERLQCEVVALWNEVAAEADRTGVRRAGVWPNNFGRHLRFDGWRPVMLSNGSTAFSFKKTEGGAWVKAGGWVPGECSE